MSNQERLVKGWHFLSKSRRLGYRDGRLVEEGEVLSVDVKPVLCEAGLHASPTVYDAFQFATGPVLCRVEAWGDLEVGEDRFTGRHRRVIAMADASEVLRRYARLCALDVVDQWDAPEIAREFLETGDDRLRAAAGEAAGEAARYAARAAWAAAGVEKTLKLLGVEVKLCPDWIGPDGTRGSVAKTVEEIERRREIRLSREAKADELEEEAKRLIQEAKGIRRGARYSDVEVDLEETS